MLHFLVVGTVGALLPCAAQAQDDLDFSRLIFEVAPIPQESAAAPGAAAGGAEAGTGAAGNASPGTEVVAVDVSPDRADTNINLDADIRAYRARISDTQANDNPYSSALREQFDALGVLLQQTGEHADAIAAFESAMHIDRVNGGLYTLDQISLVEKIIASHEELANFDEVNDFHEYLFYIQQKNFDEGDPRLLAAKEDWADWNVESWFKEGARDGSFLSLSAGSPGSSRSDYVAVQNRDGSFSYVPRMLVLSAMGSSSSAAFNDLTLNGGGYSMPADMIVDERLRTARDYYEEIVEAQSADASLDTDNHRVAHKLAKVAYAVKKQIDDIEMVDVPGSMYQNRVLQPRSTPLVVSRGYTENRDTLLGIAEELEQDPTANAQQKAQAYINLGDWHVGFDFASRGDDAYRKAWELLRDAGMDDAEINAVFMPELLIPAPGFATHDYSRELYGIAPDDALAYKGYMDLSVNVSRYGDVRGVDIVAVSPGTPQVLRNDLLDFLRGQKMRPAFVNGEAVKRDDVKLRYYYSY